MSNEYSSRREANDSCYEQDSSEIFRHTGAHNRSNRRCKIGKCASRPYSHGRKQTIVTYHIRLQEMHHTQSLEGEPGVPKNLGKKSVEPIVPYSAAVISRGKIIGEPSSALKWRMVEVHTEVPVPDHVGRIRVVARL